MAEPGNPPEPDEAPESGKAPEPGKPAEAGSLRELAEKALLAGLSLLDAAKDQAQEAVGSKTGPPLKERAQGAITGVAGDLGFVTRDRYEELELKVAQLEHRLRLLEQRDLPPADSPEQ